MWAGVLSSFNQTKLRLLVRKSSHRRLAKLDVIVRYDTIHNMHFGYTTLHVNFYNIYIYDYTFNEGGRGMSNDP